MNFIHCKLAIADFQFQIEQSKMVYLGKNQEPRFCSICNLQFVICNLPLFLVILFISITPKMLAAESSPLAAVIDRVQPKVVKIYGAGGYRGLEPYQS
jgi:hypothetical protein